ncbi:MAG: aminotransferase class III-fold pyridoxal phosphate-dependent enzyme, partial [Planctomycetota bacterium]
AFYHGHTFSGNPIAAAAALAALDVYEEENIVERSRPAAEALAEGMCDLGGFPCVRDAGSLGMMGMMELSEESGGAVLAGRIASRALGLGLHVRPLGSVLYLWPPLIVSLTELGRMLSILKEAVSVEAAQSPAQ